MPPTPSPRTNYGNQNFGNQNSGNQNSNNQDFGYPCIQLNAPTSPPNNLPLVSMAPSSCADIGVGDNDPLMDRIVTVILGDIIGAIVGAAGSFTDAFFNATTFGDSFGLDDVAFGGVLITSTIRSIVGSILAFFAAFLDQIFLN